MGQTERRLHQCVCQREDGISGAIREETASVREDSRAVRGEDLNSGALSEETVSGVDREDAASVGLSEGRRR